MDKLGSNKAGQSIPEPKTLRTKHSWGSRSVHIQDPKGGQQGQGVQVKGREEWRWEPDHLGPSDVRFGLKSETAMASRPAT